MKTHQFAFLISSERSGSNFITKVLDCHPSVSGPSPIHLLRCFAPLEHKYGDLNKNENWHRMLLDVVEFYNKKISHWDSAISYDELAVLEPRSLSICFKHIYVKEASLLNQHISFVKENHAYRLIPYYLLNFHKPHFIWSYRDPRDMALSWKKDAILRGGIVRSANVWKEDQKMSFYLYDSIFKSGKIHKVSYESLTQNTEEESIKLCEFLKIKFVPEMIKLESSVNTVKNADASPSWANLSKGVMKENSKKYLKGLDEREIKFIEFLCYDEMEKLGYEFEFPKISREKFIQLQFELSNEEKYEKLEYNSVSESEKEKRNNWLQCLNRIQNQFK